MTDNNRQSENEQKLTHLLNTIPHGIEEIDTNGVITYSNPAHHHMLGYEIGELVGKKIWDFAISDREKQALQQYLALIKQEQPSPTPFLASNITKDGRIIEVEVVWDYQYDSTGKLIGFISVLSDFTNRKETEDKVRDSEKRLIEAQTIAKLGHYVYDINSDKWVSSDVLKEIFGIDEFYPHTAVGWLELVHPDSREIMTDYFTDYVLGKHNEFDKTYKVTNFSTKETKWVHGLGRLRFDQNGNPSEMFGTIQDITERIAFEEKLHFLKQKAEQNEEKFKAITTQSTEGLTVADLEGNYTFVNPAFCAMTGYAEEELLKMTVFDVKAPDQDNSSFSRSKDSEEGMVIEVLLQRKDRSILIAEVIGKKIQFGGQTQVLGTIRDITEQVKAEEKIRTLSQAIEQSPVSVMITDTDAIIEYVNKAFEKVTGYSGEEVVGLNPRFLNSGGTSKAHYKNLWDSISKGEAWQGILQNRKKNGDTFWEQANIAPVVDIYGKIQHYIAVKEDISLRKQQEEKILHQAHFDALTDLPNRFLSLDRLAQLLNEARRDNGLVAVIFLDLDDFKKINDSLGHEMGDKLLIEAADRLRNVARSGDTVGRLGGDEFIIILGGLSDASDVHNIAEKLINRFRDTFLIDGRELMLTVSVGIASYPEDGESVTELLRNADSAMYHSKELGRNTFSYFTEAMNRDALHRIALEEQLHGAISREEFAVVYQPQVDLSSGRITGAEALLRWNNSVTGDVPPDDFIPIAEQTGLIVELGKYIITEALIATAHWIKEYSSDFKISINISPRQFRDPELVDFIESTLLQTGVASESMDLEITEGVLMSGQTYIDDALESLSVLGVNIAMDDFGTGYSSLNYLRDYPFNTLKIDQCFIDGIEKDTADRKLINAIIAMAHGLNINVVAEGVETKGQLSFLKEHGCDYAQGSLIGKPLSAGELDAIISESNTTDRLE